MKSLWEVSFSSLDRWSAKGGMTVYFYLTDGLLELNRSLVDCYLTICSALWGICLVF